MCEVLIKAIDHTHPDPETDRAGAYKRGDPVVVMDDGHTWGNEEGLPRFYILKLPGVAKADLLDHVKSWQRKISYNVDSSVPATDTHQITITATEFHAVTGEGKLTRVMVENFIEGWGGSVVSIADNSVTFSIRIIDAVKSSRFWQGWNLTGVGWAETDYVPATGLHTGTLNYFATDWGIVDENGHKKAKGAEMLLKHQGATIISHDEVTHVITFSITREAVCKDFQDDIKMKVERSIVRRKFHLGSAVMDAIEAAGGVMTATAVQYATYIKNKMTE